MGTGYPDSKRCKVQTTNLIHVQKYLFVCNIMIVGQGEVSVLPETAIREKLEAQKQRLSIRSPTASTTTRKDTKVNKYEDTRGERGKYGWDKWDPCTVWGKR